MHEATLAKVLVTGAGGFIGSHLVERLVADGHQVRAFVHYNGAGSWGWLDRADPHLLDDVEIVAGDVRDGHAVHQAVAGRDVVFHLAALIGIPYSYQAPQSYVDTNVSGTLNVLQAAADTGARVVQTSTSEVYGTAQCVPIDEDHPLHPQSPYAASKVGADQLALAFARSFDTEVVVVRPFNTYGPRQSARAVIPTIICQVLSAAAAPQNVPCGCARTPCRCAGVRLGALTPRRDFTYVADTAAGFAAAGWADAALGQVINLGSNHDIAIGDLARTIAALTGAEIEVVADDTRRRPKASEVDRLLCDNRRATALLGWQPAHGGDDGFRRGLEQTIAWFADPANRSAYKPNVYAV